MTGLAPGSSGSFDIVLVNTNAAGGASYDVSTDSLDVSIVGPAGITITGVTTSTTSPYIFAASIANDYPATFATINGAGTGFTAGDAADVVGNYPGYQVVNPGETYGLANVTFTVSAGAVPGSTDTIAINGINVDTALSDINCNLLPATAQNGTLVLSAAVPEPSTLILGLAAVLIGLGSQGWRRRPSA